MTISQIDVDFLILASTALTETSEYAAELASEFENILTSKRLVQDRYIEMLVNEIEARHLETELPVKFKPLFDEVDS